MINLAPCEPAMGHILHGMVGSALTLGVLSMLVALLVMTWRVGKKKSPAVFRGAQL